MSKIETVRKLTGYAYQKSRYVFAIILIAISVPTSALATQSFDEYAITSTNSFPLKIISSGSGGSLWYIERSSSGSTNTIGNMSTSGVVLGDYSIATAAYPNATLRDIALGSDGNIWFTACAATASGSGSFWAVGKLDATTGTPTFYYITSTCTNTYTPTAMFLGPDGNIWFMFQSNYGLTNYLYSVTTSGVLTNKKVWYGSSMSVTGILTDSSSNIWMLEGFSNTVRKLTSSGGAITGETTYAIPSNPSGPTDLNIGSDGNLWFVEVMTDKVAKMTMSGVFTEYTLPSGSADGLTAGPDGALWYADYSSNKIGRLTTSGSVTEYTVPTASAGIANITTGPDGALWFTERFAKKVGRIGY